MKKNSQKKDFACLTMWLGLLGLFMCIFVPSYVAAQTTSTPNQSTWVTDGPVHSIAFGDDGTTYIGGSFTRVGAANGAGVPVSTSTGNPQAVFPRVKGGDIRAVVSDGSGGWFIGGLFTSVGGVSQQSLAHILPDGTFDAGWNPNVVGPVYALALDGSTLYVGGTITSVGGQTRNRIAAVNASTGAVTDWNPNINGPVLSVAVGSGTVYVAGTFTSVGVDTRNRIAAINAVTGAATSWNPNSDSNIHSIAVSGSTIYAGGEFTTIGANSQTRNRIAALDADGNATLWNPNADNQVLTIVVSGSTVYVGGIFTTIGVNSQTRNSIAAIDSDGNATSWNPNVGGGSSVVWSIAVSGSTIYAGGTFTSIGGQTRNRIAAIDAVTGVPTSWNPGANEAVYVLAVSGGTIYTGGAFSLIGGTVRNYLAAINPATGEATGWNPNADGVVYAVTANSGTIYVGGYFNTVGGASRDRIAALDTNGNATSWNPNANANALVQVIKVSGTTVYVGGIFTSMGGQSRNNIAAISASTGLANTWNPNSNGDVLAIVPSGTLVYAGGSFTSIGNQTRSRIAAIDADPASGTFGNAALWNPNANDTVRSIAVSGSTIYVGGSFTTIGGQSRNNIAAIDASTGLASAWNPNSSPADGVYGIAVSGTTLYAAGGFTSIGGQTRYNLAAVSTSTGLATSWNPQTGYAYGRTVVLNDSSVYVGGIWLSVTGPIHNFARFGEVLQFTGASGTASESTSTVDIALSLSAVLSVDAAVNYAVTDGTAAGSGTDYTLASGTAAITAGSTTANISITINNDALDEVDETVIITLSGPSNAGLGANTTYTLTITDNDGMPTVTISRSAASFAEAGGSVEVTAALSAISGRACTVDLDFTGTAVSADYTKSGSSIVIPANSRTASITISGVNDSIAEDDETIIVSITGATNCSGTGSVTFTIAANDAFSGGGGDDDDDTDGDGSGDDDSGGSGSGEGGSGSRYVIVFINLVTNEECGTGTTQGDNSFSIELDFECAKDPDDPATIRGLITAIRGARIFQTIIEITDTESASESADAKSLATGTTDAGDIDAERTLAAQLSLKKIEALGLSAIRNRSFVPSSYQNIMASLFRESALSSSGVSSTMAAGRDVCRCLLSKGLSPQTYGFASCGEIISGNLDDNQRTALARLAESCSLDRQSIFANLGELDMIESLNDLVLLYLQDEESADAIGNSSDELTSLINVIMAIDRDILKERPDAMGRAIIDTMKDSRGKGNYIYTDRRLAAIFAAAIGDDDIDLTDPEKVELVRTMIETADIENYTEIDDLRALGRVFGDYVGNNGNETVDNLAETAEEIIRDTQGELQNIRNCDEIADMAFRQQCYENYSGNGGRH